jgi:hypothetical protein
MPPREIKRYVRLTPFSASMSSSGTFMLEINRTQAPPPSSRSSSTRSCTSTTQRRCELFDSTGCSWPSHDSTELVRPLNELSSRDAAVARPQEQFAVKHREGPISVQCSKLFYDGRSADITAGSRHVRFTPDCVAKVARACYAIIESKRPAA